jgi:hypothetical protein
MDSLLRWLETFVLMLAGLIPARTALAARPVYVDAMKPNCVSMLMRAQRARMLTETSGNSFLEPRFARVFQAMRSQRGDVLF